MLEHSKQNENKKQKQKQTLFQLIFRQCTIKITLNNEGADGYQQEKYGNSIIVERKINRGTENKSGTSSYKLKGANGKR